VQRAEPPREKKRARPAVKDNRTKKTRMPPKGETTSGYGAEEKRLSEGVKEGERPRKIDSHKKKLIADGKGRRVLLKKVRVHTKTDQSSSRSACIGGIQADLPMREQTLMPSKG